MNDGEKDRMCDVIFNIQGGAYNLGDIQQFIQTRITEEYIRKGKHKYVRYYLLYQLLPFLDYDVLDYLVKVTNIDYTHSLFMEKYETIPRIAFIPNSRARCPDVIKYTTYLVDHGVNIECIAAMLNE